MAKREAMWRRPELRAVTDSAEDFVQLLDPDFRHLFANRPLAEALERSPDDFAGRTLAELGVPEPICRQWHEALSRVLEHGTPEKLEYAARLRHGLRDLQTLVAPVKGADGSIRALCAITRDITEWKRAEALHAGQNQVMRKLAAGARLPELLATIVQLVEEHAPGRSCAVMLLSPDGRHLAPGHAPNLPSELVTALCGEPIEAGQGCCGAAAATRRMQIAPDIASDPLWRRHGPVALAHGLKACWSHPILAQDGTLLGTFAMYHRRARKPDPLEVLVVSEAALAAGIAIQHWQTQESLARDATAREAAHRALRASEERLERALQASGLGMWDWDVASGATFMDARSAEILGYAPGELPPTIDGLVGILHPDEAKRVGRTIEAHLRGEGTHYEYECRIRTRDGQWRWVWSRGQVTQRDAQGQPVRVTGTIRDIDAERRMQDRLDTANTQIQLLLEATDEGIVGLDAGGACSFANPAAARLLGCELNELLGRDFYDLVRHTRDDGTELARETSPIYRCVRDRVAFRGVDEFFWRRDTTGFPIEYSVSPVGDGAGSVRGAVLVFRDVSEKRSLAQQLQHQAMHDPLTGLMNRRGFEHKLLQLLTTARTQNRSHALCYVDLDHFKVVNDTCGHAAGDELLRQLPQVLQPLVRRSDTVARLGGDEFAILLEDCLLEDAARIAEAVRDAVRDFRFVWQYRTFTIGASIGVVGINAESHGLVSVLGAADTACYVAKDQGPNHVHVSYPHDLAIIRRRGEMRWVARIKSALEENQFRLHYQSMVPLERPGLPARSHELLIRLVDAKGDLIMPGAFLQAAERYQLMPLIDDWVVENALRFLGEVVVPDRRFAGHRFGINLSGESVRDTRLLEFIEQALVRHKVPATALYFEVTETAAIANLGSAVEFMRRLKEMGCLLALDDFGSGMSSFSYLKHLPVDFLKIDGSFIKDIVNNPVDQAIVRAVQAVGQQMGLATIAEYVESKAILECLRTMGVNYGQGHAIARPLPLEEFPRLAEPAAASA